MNFSEFANLIGSVLKKESNTSVFVHTLFEAIIPEERYCLLEGIADSTLGAYYNGRTNITVIAKKISNDVRTDLFEEYVKENGKLAVQKLCIVFANVLEGINEKNAAKKLAELFNNIISEAASVNRKTNQVVQGELTENNGHSTVVAHNSEGAKDMRNSEKVQNSKKMLMKKPMIINLRIK